jgi:hypothetical protein
MYDYRGFVTVIVTLIVVAALLLMWNLAYAKPDE